MPKIPEVFESFQGYNDHKCKKTKQQPISSSGLKSHGYDKTNFLTEEIKNLASVLNDFTSTSLPEIPYKKPKKVIGLWNYKIKLSSMQKKTKNSGIASEKM